MSEDNEFVSFSIPEEEFEFAPVDSEIELLDEELSQNASENISKNTDSASTVDEINLAKDAQDIINESIERKIGVISGYSMYDSCVSGLEMMQEFIAPDTALDREMSRFGYSLELGTEANIPLSLQVFTASVLFLLSDAEIIKLLDISKADYQMAIGKLEMGLKPNIQEWFDSRGCLITFSKGTNSLPILIGANTFEDVSLIDEDSLGELYFDEY